MHKNSTTIYTVLRIKMSNLLWFFLQIVEIVTLSTEIDFNCDYLKRTY